MPVAARLFVPAALDGLSASRPLRLRRSWRRCPDLGTGGYRTCCAPVLLRALL